MAVIEHTDAQWRAPPLLMLLLCQVELCSTVREVQLELEIEEDAVLEVQEGLGTGSRVARVRRNTQIVRDDVAVLQRCLEACACAVGCRVGG